MVEIGVEVHDRLPEDLAPTSVVRFFPEYSAPHPLWLDSGFPNLGDLHLPEDLATRLLRWAAYWNDTYRWDDGWPAGTPASWWVTEHDALPPAVAIALGRDFAVHVDQRFIRSPGPARSPEAAAALHAIQHAAAAEAAHVAAEVRRGGTFTLWAGGTSYADRLAERRRDQEPPTD
jgi:hypothetical protein